jgi:hypothetical protein
VPASKLAGTMLENDKSRKVKRVFLVSSYCAEHSAARASRTFQQTALSSFSSPLSSGLVSFKLFFYPETKGISLEELQKKLRIA